MRLGALFSGGKDSTYAIYLAKKKGHEITCLIVIKSKNPASYMYHTPAIGITKLQAEAMNVPVIFQPTPGEKEKELEDLEKALKEAKSRYQIEGITSGALFSSYQKERIEKVCSKLGLKMFSPLWHKDQESEMHELFGRGFKFILTAIAAEGLDEKWLRKEITETDLEILVRLNKALGLNIAGEGGEYESLVLDCPLFRKRLVIEEAVIKKESATVARLEIKKVKLVEK